MAFLEEAVTTLTFVFRDRGGLSGKTQLMFPAHVPVERIIAQLEPVIIPRIVALSDATLTGWSLARGATELEPAPPDLDSFVGRKGAFRFRTARNRSVSMEIPSVRRSLQHHHGSARSTTINTAHPDVAAFIAMLTDDAVLGDCRPCSVDGVPIVALDTAEKITRTRKGG